MDMIHKIQNLLSRGAKKKIVSNQKADKAPKTNESKSADQKQSEQALKEIYGTTHLFI